MKTKNYDGYFKAQESLLIEEAYKNRYDNQKVVVSNKIARSKNNLTILEEKLLFIMISQLNPYGQNETTIKLHIKDLAQKLGLNSTSAYDDIKQKIISLMSKSFADFLIDGNERYGYIIYNAERKRYDEYLSIDINPRMMPYLENLAMHYTQMNLDPIVQFSSKHTLSLYKYLSSWAWNHYHRAIAFSTKEIKEVFGLSKEDYTRKDGTFDRYNFEKRVISVAVDEINAKVDTWILSWDKHKLNKQVRGYKFEWIDKERFKTHNSTISDEEIIKEIRKYEMLETLNNENN